MKALIVSQAGQLEFADIGCPEIGPYSALVRIEACGICNSTDHKLIAGTMFWAPPFPIVLGHESVGTVVARGAKVQKFQIGDRVTRPVYVPPPGQTALHAANGGFAEFGVVWDLPAMLQDGNRSLETDYNAQRQLIVPPDISPVQAALAISLSETASVLQHLPEVRGRNIVVAGTGVAGLTFGLWLKLAGARVITVGRRGQRLAKAQTMGADVLVDTKQGGWREELRQAVGGLADGLIEATGDAALAGELVGLLKPGGFASAYGVPPTGTTYPAPWKPSVVEEFLSFEWVISLLRHRWIQPEWLVTHTWPFAQALEAFRQVDRGEVLKGFIVMS